MANKFYITTAIVYTNGPPHIGYAFELIQADVIARFHRSLGDEVRFLTGTDEHGSSVAKAAAKAETDTKVFVDQIAEQVQDLGRKLNISNDDFIRTTDRERHWPTAIKLWNILVEKGDLYKKEYEGLYCVGHESFIKKSDLVDGLCPLHKTEPEKIKEENWFFKLTNYKKDIKEKIKKGELKILPETKVKEILNLLDDAEDVSFSRPTSTLTWGIPVPNDSEQTMYVWVDALSNYISALGYADDGELFRKFWPADVHLIGKDILRFHAMIWPAILLATGIELPKAIYVHGFINVEGEKMSKTVGNVIDPFKMVEKYGSEVVRFFLLREIPSDEDGDFSEQKLIDRYNGDLANGLGNLVQRVVTLVDSKLNSELTIENDLLDATAKEKVLEINNRYRTAFDNFKLHEALVSVWDLIGFANKYIDDNKPWEQVKRDEKEFLKTLVNSTYVLAHVTKLLEPFIPETTEKIYAILGGRPPENLDGYKFIIKKGQPLFPRI